MNYLNYGKKIKKCCLRLQHQCEPIDVDTLKALIERKSPSIQSDYEASGMLSEISRKRLVKIAVGGLVERSGL